MGYPCGKNSGNIWGRLDRYAACTATLPEKWKTQGGEAKNESADFGNGGETTDKEKKGVERIGDENSKENTKF